MKKKQFIPACIALMCLWGCEDSTTLTVSKGGQNRGNGETSSEKPGKTDGSQDQPGGADKPGGNDQPGGTDQSSGNEGGTDPSGGNEGGTDQSGGNEGGDDPSGGSEGGEESDLEYDVIGGIASGLEDFDCEDGERACDDLNYAECREHRFIVIDQCAGKPDKPMCDDDYGCIACYPGELYCSTDGNDVYACSEDGQVASFVKSCLSNPCVMGACESLCPEDAQFIYLVDTSYNLIKFNPGDETGSYFTVLHHLNCSTSGATPFSMAVDRDAKAWVLYNDGTLYKVDIVTNACETMTNFRQNGSGLVTFGMGFSLDTVGGTHDSLFIADINKSGTFGRIETDTMAFTPFAAFSSKYEQTPELTGTGLAKLYAFAPGTHQQYIDEIDKTTGEVVKSFTLPGAGASINAWAFAHWGGYFFAFYTAGGVNRVYRFTPETNQFEVFVDHSPYRVVGAGVSTCAPVEVN